MAIGIAIGLAVVSIAYGMYMVSQIKGVPPVMTDMQPNTMDAFQVTKVSEGVVTPVIFGRARITGNILWYGNLRSTPNYQTQVSEVQDGKSTKTVTQEYIASYRYYLSMWQLLCEGEASYISAWVNDKEQELPVVGGYGFASGVDNHLVDVQSNEFIKPLEGLSWIYMHSQLLGTNTTQVQTLHYLIERIPTTIFSGNKTIANGINPAYIVYCLLINAGAIPAQINIPSFVDAAIYWESKGYGLNVTFTAQTTLRSQIKQVLSYVGGYFGEDSENKFRIKAFDPSEAAVDTLTKSDFISFQLARKSWDDTFNTFTGNYIDEDMQYTKRTVSAVNVANLNLQGYTKPMSVDLTAFRDRPSAEKRIWEIMKEQSYPAANVSFTTFLDKAELEIGSVVTIAHSDYGLGATYYRIIAKSMGLIDENKLSFTATQVVERIFDGNYVATTGGEWIEPATAPQAPDHQRVFEMPFNSISGTSPGYLLLSTKGNTSETGFAVYTSTTAGGDYTNQGSYGDNALYGITQAAYSSSTYEIDDDPAGGILFTPDAEYPVFGDVTRTNLFSNSRFILIDDEIMNFQDITPEGIADYRLTGVVRGLFNTTIATHAISSPIWIFSLSYNILAGIPSLDFYVKMIPIAGSSIYDPALVTPIHVMGTNKAKIPITIPRVVGIRSGANVSMEWWPITKYSDGAGTFDPGSTVDSTWPLSDNYPMLFDGAFQYSTDGSTWIDLSATDVIINNALGFSFRVREVVEGVTGAITTLVIGASDGTYKI